MLQATGVILAGGISPDLPTNKAFIKISGHRIVDIIIKKLRNTFSEIIIISNDIQHFDMLGIPVYPDIIPRLGPVSGIHAALHYSSYDTVFIQACDMPFLNMQLVEYMCKELGDHDIIIPEVNSNWEPLAAVYARDTLPIFERSLKNYHLKLVQIMELLNIKTVSEAQLKAYGNVKEMFFNVNDMLAVNQANIIAHRYLTPLIK